MLIREGLERTSSIDVRLASSLAGIAGAVNAAAFQATGFFSANMTGNASSLSDHLGLGQWSIAGLFAAMIASFVAGAFAASFFVEEGKRRGWRGVYAMGIAVEGLLMALLGLLDLKVPGLGLAFTLSLCLGALMGWQNALTSRLSDGRVRTTHVSGMATDLGIYLASYARGHRGQASERVKLFGATLASFVLGGIAGVALYVVAGGMVFVAAGLLLLAVGAFEVRRARLSVAIEP